MSAPEILLIILLLSLLFLFWKYSELRGRTERKAQQLFDEWKAKEEKRIGEQAIKRSEAVITGKVTEQLLPHFPEFKHNPKDARFLGTPIDFVVFDGLSQEDLRKIVFVEVKTGKSELSQREKLIRKCIEERNVRYEEIRRD